MWVAGACGAEPCGHNGLTGQSSAGRSWAVRVASSATTGTRPDSIPARSEVVVLITLLDTLFDGSVVSVGIRREVPSAAEALSLCSRVSLGSGPRPRTVIV